MKKTVVRSPYGSAQNSDPSRLQHLWNYLLLALLALGDAVNFQIAFALRYPNTEGTIIWGLVLTATLAAVVTIAFAGRESRKAAAADPQARRGLVPLAVAFWAGLGLTAFAVRLSSTMPADAASSGSFGAAALPASESGWVQEAPAAALFLFVYLACGIAAYLIEYNGYNPLREKLLVARRRVVRAQRASRRTSARRSRAEATHALILSEQDGWTRRREATVDALEGLAAEAKAHSRLEIARHLGEPGDTSGVLRATA